MPLIGSSEYAAIRAAIDISLDSAALPDAIIALDIYIGAAIRDVLAVDPDAESRSGDDLAHAKAAAVFFCAARLIGALPQIIKETLLGQNSYERQRIDVDARAAQLRGLASGELDAYIDAGDQASDLPTAFSVASGRRGRW